MTASARRRVGWVPPMLLALAGMACAVAESPSTAATDATHAAQTIEAVWASQTIGSLTAPPSEATAIPAPASTATPVPTLPPAATNADGCTDRAAFVADVSIPDDTNVPPGEPFAKVWRLKNTGTCTWTTAYSIVFVDGNNMGGPPSLSMASNVAPNETVDLSIDLRAPVIEGVHRGNWRLRSSSGSVFGIDGDGPFYVQIAVGPTLTPGSTKRTIYDLTENYCEAEWRSGAGVLPCPGTEGDANGFILRLDGPRFENDVTEDELTLLTRPQMSTDGVISGRYPPLQVMNGYHLKTHIGCRYDSTQCNVIYQLNYRVDGGTLQNLKQWTQRYDGEWQKVDVDLSSLSGKSVEFVLAVAANGASSDDDALWLNPKIVQ